MYLLPFLGWAILPAVVIGTVVAIVVHKVAKS